MGKWKLFKLKIGSLVYKKNIKIGEATRVDGSVILDVPMGGSIKIGKRCDILQGVIFLTYGGDIEVGDDCSFNPYCVIYGHGGLKIGNKVRIATHTVIIPANHSFDNTDIPIMNQDETRKGIVIGDDVWIGNGVRILDGVKIGNGVVVAAGAVVTKDIPDFALVAGVPAKILKYRK